MREAQKLCRPRYNATKNLFAVHHDFYLLEKTITNLGLENEPQVIWKCDKSELLHGPKTMKIVSAKGQRTFQAVAPHFM